jgi:hypothetical protein
LALLTQAPELHRDLDPIRLKESYPTQDAGQRRGNSA